MGSKNQNDVFTEAKGTCRWQNKKTTFIESQGKCKYIWTFA